MLWVSLLYVFLCEKCENGCGTTPLGDCVAVGLVGSMKLNGVMSCGRDHGGVRVAVHQSSIYCHVSEQMETPDMRPGSTPASQLWDIP